MKRSKFYITQLLLKLALVSDTSAQNLTKAEDRKLKSEHSLAVLWRFCSLGGVIGTILNGYVLYLFISERKSLLTSVNAMIL